MNSLKKIINSVFLVNIDDKTRQRKLVDSKKAYSKILRDIKFTYKYIGDTLEKDHSTIVHYVKSIDGLMEYDLVFRNKFLLAKEIFLKENEEFIKYLEENIYSTVIILENRLENILSKKNQMLCELDKYEKEMGSSECIDYCKKLISTLQEDDF